MKPWDAGDRALLHVCHTTRLVYAEPVVEAHTEVRKTPVDTARQRVVTAKLDVAPAAKVRGYVDYFGTRVHAFNVLEPHGALVISAEAVVETRDERFLGPGSVEDLPADAGRLVEYLHWSPAVPGLDVYGTVAHGVSTELAPPDFPKALAELGESVYERFRYDPDATDVHSSPEVLFEGGGGVCQDFAHALIGVLRRAGVPARYVSGYVHDPARGETRDPVRGAASSHAWVEAWHPRTGWTGVDPTNHRLVDWQYVQVAAGRDYTDVQPLRGVFVGSDDQDLEVEVRVERIG
jgi:transglutaminase-like putative cysteine protease